MKVIQENMNKFILIITISHWNWKSLCILESLDVTNSQRFKGDHPWGVQEKYELEEMPRARATCPLTASTLATPTYAYPDPSENFGERSRRLLNEISTADASTNNNRMVVAKNMPAEAETQPQPDTFVDTAF